MLHYLDEEFPVELMPEVLAFVQKEPDRRKIRNMMYNFLRYCPPSLYSFRGALSSSSKKRKREQQEHFI